MGPDGGVTTIIKIIEFISNKFWRPLVHYRHFKTFKLGLGILFNKELKLQTSNF